MLMATLLFGSAVAKADVVLDWNAIAVNTAIANGQNPVAQARFAAIAQLAVFEAVNAGLPNALWRLCRLSGNFVVCVISSDAAIAGRRSHCKTTHSSSQLVNWR
jgi:hypothetical protein